MHVFHEVVVAYFYGTLRLSREIVDQQPAVTALLAAALACCGCDFVEIKGMRVDLVLPIVRDIVRNHREHLGAMAHVFAAERATVLRAASALEFLISEFADAICEMPRRGTGALGSPGVVSVCVGGGANSTKSTPLSTI
jgi:hypothetical protein